MKKVFNMCLIIVVLLCGIVLSGCDPESSSLSLSFPQKKIELLITDEYKEYSFEVKGSEVDTLHFDLGFDELKASIVGKVESLGKGKYTFKIAPKMVGETTLTITIKGYDIKQKIPVYISNEIIGISAKDNVYVLRGESRKITSADFNFTPEKTSQTAMSFDLQDKQELEKNDITWNEVTNTLYVSESSSGVEQVNIIATSLVSDAISCILPVKIVSKIDTKLLNLRILSYGQDAENLSQFSPSDMSVLYEEGEAKGTLDFTTNDSANFRKHIVVSKNLDDGYCVDVSVKGEISGDISESTPIIGIDGELGFDIQVNSTTAEGEKYDLLFKVYQEDFVENNYEFSIDVTAKSIPKEIRVNNQLNVNTIKLYDNNKVEQSLKFTVYPSLDSSYNKDEYKYRYLFYQTDDESLTGTKTELDIEGVSKYISISYNNVKLNELENADEIITNLTTLDAFVTISPVAMCDKYIAIVLECYDTDGQVVCSNVAYVKVYKGSEVFGIDTEKYNNSTIFVAMPKNNDIFGEIKFDDFVLEDGGKVGSLSVSPSFANNNALCCNVYVDTMSDKPALIINPIMVGVSEFNIKTENGLTTTIRIVVIREIEISDFALVVTNTDNKYITSYTTKDNGSIDSLTIKGKGNEVSFKEIIKNYSDTNEFSYSYSLSLVSETYFTINDKTLKSVEFSDDKVANIVVSLITYRVVDFKLVEVEDKDNTYNFTARCVNYIVNLDLTVAKDAFTELSYDSSKKKKVGDVYNKKDLSYANTNLSAIYFYVDVSFSDGVVSNLDQFSKLGIDITIDNFKTSAYSIDSETLMVGSIGYFELGTIDDLFVGKFVCDITGINSFENFLVEFKMIDQIGIEYSSNVTINILQYIDVDMIFLVNGLSNIYLDSTETNNEVTLSTYVLPNNATLTDIRIEIETKTGNNCITYNQKGNNVTFSYLSAGSGIIRIFPISRMKTDSLRDSNDNYYYHLSIPFNCADGNSEASPLKISSLEDLKNLDVNKHYYVDSNIDCGGEELYFNNFYGTLRGTFLAEDSEGFDEDLQIGGISNFKVGYKTQNVGLFGTLNQNAKIYNLSFSGNFVNNAFTSLSTNNVYIGLLVGYNKGEIKNVSVSLYQTQNTIQISENDSAPNDMKTYFGIMVGYNDSLIQINENAKNATVLVDMSNGNLNINATETGKMTTYVGGVVGINNCKIENTYSLGTYGSIGTFGISANVNINANVSYFGGIAGANTDGGSINDLKVVGIIENTLSIADVAYIENCYVGGIVGYNKNASLINTTSRVFVRGYFVVCGLVGMYESGIVENNTVQATDDGTKRGSDISLLIKYGDNISDSIRVFYLTNNDTVDIENENSIVSYVNRLRITKNHNEDLEVDKNLSIDRYYGDVLYLDSNKRWIIDSEVLTKASDDLPNYASIISRFVLASYKKAKNSEEQIKINNEISTKELLNLAKINLKEITISVINNSLANLKGYGDKILLNGTGLLNIKISSSLNYLSSVTLSVYISEYFTNIDIYSDKDYLNLISREKLINSKPSQIFIKANAPYFGVNNERIELASNSEISFDVNIFDSNNINSTSLIEAIINRQVVYLTTLDSNTEKQAKITLRPIFKAENEIFACEFNDKFGYIFYANASQDVIKSFMVDIVTGIENLKTNKSSILAEPSDNVEFNLSYQNYGDNDEINAIAYLNDNIMAYSKENGDYTFKDINGRSLFYLVKNQSNNDGNSFIDNYSVVIASSKLAYDTIKNSNIKIIFYSQETGEYVWIEIKYTPETITSVLVNNYSFEENSDMVVVYDNKVVYSDQNLQNTSSYSSTGDKNVLKIYVYTQLSEFDYLDITMNLGKKGGYLAYAKEFRGEDNNKYYEVSYDSIILSNNEIVSMRIYRNDILGNTDDIYVSNERTLSITLLYSLPVDFGEGERAYINLDFYKSNMVCFSKETSIVAKNTKKVEFSIYNKEAENETELGYDVIYHLVKGRAYALEINSVGFNDDEIFFTTSNVNLASIENIGGVYYLRLSDIYINYNDNPYYILEISSYGEKLQGNVKIKSIEYKAKICIFEMLLDDDIFSNDKLALRVLETVDVREKVTGLLQTDTQDSTLRNTFVNSFKDNSTFNLTMSNVTVVFENGLKITSQNYDIKDFTIKPLIIYDIAEYTIGVNFSYAYKNGVPICDSSEFGNSKVYVVNTVFNVSVYLNSDEKLPMPIASYSELANILDGEYYRQTTDIVINAVEFTTITAKPKMYDGNGYKIIIKGTNWSNNLIDMQEFALFREIDQNSIFKNITITLATQASLQISNINVTSANLGVLCAINNGIITNCAIKSSYNLIINVVTSGSSMENTKFGFICGTNNGVITNSRVNANVTLSGASLGGFVAVNNGEIASCYVKNCRIANKTGSASDNIVTSGFVCTNYGKISMCYAEGNQTSEYIFCNYDFNQNNSGLNYKIIDSSSVACGFVFNNYGEVNDSYSNIPVASSSRCSGFVGNNFGKIKRSYSLSKLEANNTIKFGFVMMFDSNAVFEDCYFVIQSGLINYRTSETNYNVNGLSYTSKIEGITPLTTKMFSEFDKYFSSYITSDRTDNKTAGVWFFVDNAREVREVDSTYYKQLDEFKYYDFDLKATSNISFVANRLHLVSPNLIASSRYNLHIQEGRTISSGEYYYSIDDSNLTQGSKYNPYLISNTNEFEQYLAQQNKGVFENYRIINNIDYVADNVYNSGLYNKTFVGYIEGNSLKISNYSINSNSIYVSSGLFANIGQMNSYISVVKNIDLKPNYVNLPNCIYVGALAGTVADSIIYNVNVDGEGVIVVGNNIVGGIIGRTQGATFIRNLYSNITVKSTRFGKGVLNDKDDLKKLSDELAYMELESNRSKVSYSGSVVGYLGGVCVAKDIRIGESARSFGVISGLLVGGVGALSTIKDIKLDLNSYNNTISALAFAGYISGENRGIIKDININSNVALKNIFNVKISMPSAIGGIVGYMASGIISNISSNGYNVLGASFIGRYGFGEEQGLKDGYLYDNILNPYVVRNVGGIAGFMTGGDIVNIKIGKTETDFNTTSIVSGLIILGANNVGGVVGSIITKDKTVNISNIDIILTSHLEYVNTDGVLINEMFYTQYVSEANYNSFNNFEYISNAYFGAVVGYAENNVNNSSVLPVLIGEHIVFDADMIYMLYAKYGQRNQVEFTCHHVGNSSGGEVVLSGKYTYETYNLTTNTRVITMNND